jgi:hypothetical protein
MRNQKPFKSLQTGWMAGCMMLALLAHNAKAAPLIHSVYPPVINELAGDHVAYQVSATGTGTLFYQWYQGNSLLAGQTSFTLVLTNIQAGNSGQYQVTVVDSSGIYVTNSVMLNVSTTNLPYYPSNLVVARVGDGAQTLSGATGNTIYLDQYTTAGVYVSSLMLPDESAGSPYGAGSSASVYGSPALLLPGAGNDYMYSGMLTLSAGQQFLTIAGYCASYPFGGADVTVGAGGGAYWRGLATVNAGGSYSLAYTNSGLYSAANHSIRSAVTLDGTNFWTTGQGNSGAVKCVNTQNTVYNNGSGIPVISTASGTGTHVVQIFGTNLIYSDAAASGGSGLYICYGLPEPPANGSATATLLLNEGGQPNDFAISPDGRTIYIADSRTFTNATTPGGGIQRWDTNSVAGGYGFSYTLPADQFSGAEGLTVAFPSNITAWGSKAFGAMLFATSPTNLSAIVDNGPSSTPTVLVNTASYNELLHGVRFAPIIPGPPSIVGQPQSLSVGIGASLTFSVAAIGAAPLTYQWQFNTTNLADNAQITGSHSNVLTLANVTLGNSGTYQVVVSNSDGSANATATLSVLAVGTWTPLANRAPGGIETMLLLSDGTVMAEGGDDTPTATWYRLTPDATGSYANGRWTSDIAAMHYTRLYYSSDVLPDGRVFVAGGEYGTGTTNAEVYDPVSNIWTVIPIPSGLITTNNTVGSGGGNDAGFMDSASVVLSNGKVLVTPVVPVNYGETVTYDPVANSWSTATLYRGIDEDEACLVKLPDNSILVEDNGTASSERYIPSQKQWINDANLPVKLYDPYGDELGPLFLLPNGKVLAIGSVPYFGIYTPTGSTSPGTWVNGSLPNNLGAPDAPAAMMVNGKVLCALSPTPTSANHFPTPTYFYEYDYSTGALGTFTQVPAPGGGFSLGAVTYNDRMLDLPDGRVLFTTGGNQLYVYTPYGAPLAAGKPAIRSITQNADGSYLLAGTQLNGISQGAAYGDDAQMNSNYPLVRMTNNSSGAVYYARTYNWSSTGVMTGANIVTTQFGWPRNAPAGTYSLVVVANGIASDPISFAAAPSLAQNGGFELGTFADWTPSGNFANCSISSTAPYVHSDLYGARLGPGGSLGYLSQTLATAIGQIYQISCWLYSAGGTPNEFSVSWNGAALFDQQNIGNTGWTNLQFLASATAANTALAFGFRNDSSFFGLDDIAVYPVFTPQFQTVTLTNGTISFSWSAEEGQIYQLQSTTNLALNLWTNLGNQITAAGGTLTASDLTTNSQLFYRVVLVP